MADSTPDPQPSVMLVQEPALPKQQTNGGATGVGQDIMDRSPTAGNEGLVPLVGCGIQKGGSPGPRRAAPAPPVRGKVQGPADGPVKQEAEDGVLGDVRPLARE